MSMRFLCRILKRHLFNYENILRIPSKKQFLPYLQIKPAWVILELLLGAIMVRQWALISNSYLKPNGSIAWLLEATNQPLEATRKL